MSRISHFTPIDWSRYLRLRAQVDAVRNPAELAGRLRDETFHASRDDRRLLAWLAGDAAVRDEAAIALVGVRVDSAAYAESAALTLLSATEGIDDTLADLSRAAVPWPFRFPAYLLLAYCSEAYRKVVTGVADFDTATAFADAPPALVAALGGRLAPDAPATVNFGPEEVRKLSAELDAIDAGTPAPEGLDALLDFHEHTFGASTSLADSADDALETLRLVYKASARARWGLQYRTA
jgi:hypothetical protein